MTQRRFALQEYEPGIAVIKIVGTLSAREIEQLLHVAVRYANTYDDCAGFLVDVSAAPLPASPVTHVPAISTLRSHKHIYAGIYGVTNLVEHAIRAVARLAGADSRVQVFSGRQTAEDWLIMQVNTAKCSLDDTHPARTS